MTKQAKTAPIRARTTPKAKDKTKTKDKDKRAELLKALEALPEEAFSWFVGWAMTGYPDGLGGFKPDSRKGIEQLQAAAKDYAYEQSQA